MENFLRSIKYWSSVEHVILVVFEGANLTEGQMKVIESKILKDLKAKYYLFQAIDRSILDTILKRYGKRYFGFNEAEVSRDNKG